MELESLPIVAMRSWRINSARALWMEAHIAIERAGQTAQLIVAVDAEAKVVILARHLGGRAIELFDRLDDAARQQKK